MIELIINKIEKDLKEIFDKKENVLKLNYRVTVDRTVSIKEKVIIFSDGQESLDLYYIIDYFKMKLLTEKNIKIETELQIFDADDNFNYSEIYEKLIKNKSLKIKYCYGMIKSISFLSI